MAHHGNKYYTGYTPKDTKDAIKMYQVVNIPSQRVPLWTKFPETLSGKMKYKHANPNGRPTLLTPDEEKNLINYIHYMGEQAFPLAVQQI